MGVETIRTSFLCGNHNKELKMQRHVIPRRRVKSRGELRCCRRVSRSCSTCGTGCVTVKTTQTSSDIEIV